MTRISVALCTHNGHRYIGEQIDSILAQTLPVDEIIVGDDASADDTLNIIRERVVGTGISLVVRSHVPPLGVRENFADAISASTGDIVILCDQDDWWYPTKVARLAAELGKGALMVHSDARLVDPRRSPIGATLLRTLRVSTWEKQCLISGKGFDVLLRRNLVTGATAAVNGNFARQALPIPDGWIHDEWLAMLAALEGGLYLLPEVLTDYRQHANNQIGARKVRYLERAIRVITGDDQDDFRRFTRANALVQIARERSLGQPEQRRHLEQAARHQSLRLSLPSSRLKRIVPILRELWQGSYQRYSRGWLTALRDLLQKPH